jgi:hypothetical protein
VRTARNSEIDFDALIEPVALRLLGKPTQQRNGEWRYGTRGSLAIDLKNGRWFDHEANVGGGVLGLIRRHGHDRPLTWLACEGLLTNEPQGNGHTEPKIVAVYDYCDEKGELLFQVVRFEPKDFRQRKPDGHGGWIWKLGDTRRIPYRLPELLRAVAAGETIFIPEGEKDVDNLRAVGLEATTSPGGVKKWRNEYSNHLCGADVVVLVDNDAPGREHADQVAASLRGIAKRIRVLDIGKNWPSCPDKGDISDWLSAGGSAEKLRAMVGALPEPSAPADNQTSDQREKKPAQAEILIALVNSNVGELFRHREIAYADVSVAGHRETWPVRGTRLRQWVKRLYFAEHKKSPRAEAVQEAVDYADARAQFEGQEREVHLRVAGQGGRIYIDLGNDQRNAIEIDESGWRIVDEPPVRFRRPRGLLPLPTPKSGGKIALLRGFLNVRNNDDFVLVVCWLLAAMRDHGPYPVLDVLGEEGTAKSTLVRVLRALFDPNILALRALPREDRELFIAANNGWIQAFDNVSSLPLWLSNLLCQLSTGGGIAIRQLYTDQDEILFEVCRPIILNGIADAIVEPDLTQRTAFLLLDPIPDDKRRAEDEFWQEFERQRPLILGALLDGLAHGLRCFPDIRPVSLPRMADFAKWAMACEGAFWPAGTFTAAYERNRQDAISTVIEGDRVASAIKELMAGQTKWEGTATELKEALEIREFGADPALRHLPKGWPADPTRLSGAVRRVSSPLRKAGIYVIRPQTGSTEDRRRMTITTVRPEGSDGKGWKTASTASSASEKRGNGDATDATDANFYPYTPEERRPALGPVGDSLDDPR